VADAKALGDAQPGADQAAAGGRRRVGQHTVGAEGDTQRFAHDWRVGGNILRGHQPAMCRAEVFDQRSPVCGDQGFRIAFAKCLQKIAEVGVGQAIAGLRQASASEEQAMLPMATIWRSARSGR
jgi:hypothetical protein